MDDVRFFPVTRCYQASGHWNRILRLTLCRFDTFDISSTSGALLSCVIATIRPTSESARPKNRNPGFGRVPRLSHPLTTCPRLPLAIQMCTRKTFIRLRPITSQDMFKGCFYQSGSRPRRDPDSLMLINSETKDVDVLTSIPFANLLSYSRKRL